MPPIETPEESEASLADLVELLEDASTPRLTGSPRVLLVEDDVVFRAELAELLAGEGFDISTATDGAEALSHLQREPPPAAILLDLVMPGMSGVSFRMAQLASPALSAIPTIAMTSLRDTSHLTVCRFTAVLTKPFDFDRLVEVLVTACMPPVAS